MSESLIGSPRVRAVNVDCRRLWPLAPFRVPSSQLLYGTRGFLDQNQAECALGHDFPSGIFCCHPAYLANDGLLAFTYALPTDVLIATQ
jgi:hypothetical protein